MPFNKYTTSDSDLATGKVAPYPIISRGQSVNNYNLGQRRSPPNIQSTTVTIPPPPPPPPTEVATYTITDKSSIKGPGHSQRSIPNKVPSSQKSSKVPEKSQSQSASRKLSEHLFPFKRSPSGLHLQITSREIAYENKDMSFLVAHPHKTRFQMRHSRIDCLPTKTPPPLPPIPPPVPPLKPELKPKVVKKEEKKRVIQVHCRKVLKSSSPSPSCSSSSSCSSDGEECDEGDYSYISQDSEFECREKILRRLLKKLENSTDTDLKIIIGCEEFPFHLMPSDPDGKAQKNRSQVEIKIGDKTSALNPQLKSLKRDKKSKKDDDGRMVDAKYNDGKKVESAQSVEVTKSGRKLRKRFHKVSSQIVAVRRLQRNHIEMPNDEPSKINLEEKRSSLEFQTNELGLLVFGGCTSSGALRKVYRFNKAKGEWEKWGNLPIPLRQVGVVIMNGTIYVFGGVFPLNPGGEMVNINFWSYNPALYKEGEKRSWSQLPPIPLPSRESFGWTSSRNQVYIFGGRISNNNRRGSGGILETGRCERFDCVTRVWSSIAPLIEPRWDFGVAKLGNNIWVAGGRSSGIVLDSVEIYEPNFNRWRKGPPLPASLCSFKLIACNDRLFAVGGLKHGVKVHSHILSYFENIHKWDKVGSLSVPVYNLAVTTYGKYLIIIGGQDESHNAQSIIQTFNTEKTQSVSSVGRIPDYPFNAYQSNALYIK